VRTFPFRHIEAHHIEPWCKRPDLFFDLNNGITLCTQHHRAITGDEERWASHLVGVLKRRRKLWTNGQQNRQRAITGQLIAKAQAIYRARRRARIATRRSRAKRKRTVQ